VKLISNLIIKKLKKKKLKISVAESCSGGLISSNLTSVSGSSQVFTLGLITYSNESKIKILKVPKKVISIYGAVSSECCEAMVKNVSKMSKSNISISTTGIAGPKGGSRKKPIGTVYIGIKINNKINVFKCLFKNKDRISIQKMTVNKAFRLVMHLLK
jgi:nicotinamide-nucleotide amidase